MTEKWFYGRVSSVEQQEDRFALQKQLERGKNYGCTKFYWDIQSRTTEVREGLQKLTDDLQISPKGRVSELVVLRIDRIGSSSRLFYGLLEVLRSKNIKLIAIDQTIDTDSIGGELTIDILLAAAKFEVKMLSNRVSSERKLRMAQRKSHRLAPFGWVVVGDRYKTDESWVVSLIDGKRSFRAWELALFIFDIFDETESVRGTCRRLNELFGTSGKVHAKRQRQASRNYTTDIAEVDLTPKRKREYRRYPWAGLQWSPDGLKNYLVNPVHAGGTGYNVAKKTRTGRKTQHFDKRDVNWGTHEGIISRDRHERVKRIIRGNANNRWIGTDKINPYANLLKCDRCGGAMTRASGQCLRGGKKIYYFQCAHFGEGRCDVKKTIRSDRLDEQVIDFLTKEAVRMAGSVDLDLPPEEPKELAELRETLASLEKMPPNPFVEKAIDGVRLQIKEVMSLNTTSNVNSLMLRDELSRLLANKGFWHLATDEEKKKILARFVRRIVVSDGCVVGIDFL